MRLTRAIELMREYGRCPDCGNEHIGNESGSLEVEGDTFRRICKCGFKVEITEKTN